MPLFTGGTKNKHPTGFAPLAAWPWGTGVMTSCCHCLRNHLILGPKTIMGRFHCSNRFVFGVFKPGNGEFLHAYEHVRGFPVPGCMLLCATLSCFHATVKPCLPRSRNIPNNRFTDSSTNLHNLLFVFVCSMWRCPNRCWVWHKIALLMCVCVFLLLDPYKSQKKNGFWTMDLAFCHENCSSRLNYAVFAYGRTCDGQWLQKEHPPGWLFEVFVVFIPNVRIHLTHVGWLENTNHSHYIWGKIWNSTGNMVYVPMFSICCCMKCRRFSASFSHENQSHQPPRSYWRRSARFRWFTF